MVALTHNPALDGAATGEIHDDDDLLSGPAWSRHPTDMARFVVSALALAVAVVLSLRHPGEVRSVSVDVVELVSQFPAWFRTLVLGFTQLYMIVAAVILVVVLGQRPRRLFFTGLLASLAAAGVMALLQGWLEDAVPNRVMQINLQSSWVIGAAFPSPTFLAAFTAGAIVLGPSTSQGWRRVMTVTIAVAALLRVVTAVAVPLNLAVTVSLGFTIGSAALFMVGSPRRSASRRAVLSGLQTSGFPAESIEPVELGASHSRTFLASTASGRAGFVKLLGRDERDAYVIQRFLKRLRVKGLEDQRASWTVEDLIRNEGLSALLARRRGVNAPDVLAVGVTEGQDGLLVTAVEPGERLADMDPNTITDQVLDEVWAQLLRLRAQGIAHRWFTASQLLVTVAGTNERYRWGADAPGSAKPAAAEAGSSGLSHGADVSVKVIDFRWAVHQAEPHQLAADLAMLVTSLGLLVGADRSVAAAARALGPEELATALPLIQPLALPDDLKRGAAEQPELLPEVRDRLQAAAGGVAYELADIERIKPTQVLGLAGGVLMAYTLLSFATSWRHIASALGQVPLLAFPELAFLALFPYVLGAGLLISMVLRPLPLLDVVKLMFAQSFLNRFTPANAGGMALRVRYLQKRGVDLGSAAATIALSSVAAGLGQAVSLLVFTVWAGSTGSGVGFELPDANSMAVGLVVVLTLAAAVWFTPWGRRMIARHVVTTVRQVWAAFRGLLAQPGRFVAAMSLTLLSKLFVIVTFSESCRALDISVAFPKLGLLYLTASALASAAPTPGGVGAVEAALAAALTGVGVPAGDALSAVFLFRLMTYWLPVPFGYVALRRLRGDLLD